MSDPQKNVNTSTDPLSKLSLLPIPAGLELVYSTEKSNVHSVVHAFVLSVHWAIIRAGLRFHSSSNDTTERLPDGWSTLVNQISQGKLIFNYIDPITEDKFEIKFVEVSPNDTIVVTVFRRVHNKTDSTSKSTNTQKPGTATGSAATAADKQQQTSSASTFQIGTFFKMESFNKESNNTPPPENLSQVCLKPNELEYKVWTDLFEPIGMHVLGKPPVPGPYEDKTKKEEKKQEQGSNRIDSSLFDYDQEGYGPGIGPRPSPLIPGPVQPGGIGGPLGMVPPLGGGLGRSDLDPLGRFGAGMIGDPRGFNPRRPPVGIGPGQLPPGARFDPFGPGVPPPGPATGPRPGNFGQPNPDNERPPDGFDDMFM